MKFKNLVVGIDTGNSFIKAVIGHEITDTKDYEVCSPEVFQKPIPSGTAPYFENLLGEIRGTDGLEYNTCEIEDSKFFIGKDADKLAGFSHTNLGISRYDREEFYITVLGMYSSIAKEYRDLYEIPEEGIKFISSLTIPIYLYNNKRQEIEDKFKDRLNGFHETVVNGKKILFEIEFLRTLPEGITSFVTGLPKDKDIIIIDPGGGTIDVASVKKGNIDEKDTFTIPDLGVDTLFKEIQDQIIKNEPALYPSYGQIEEQYENEFFRTGKYEIPFTEIRRKAEERWRKSVENKLTVRIKDFKKFDEIYLVGGGAKLLHPQLKQFGAKIVDNPQFSTAKGAYLFTVNYLKSINQKIAKEISKSI